MRLSASQSGSPRSLTPPRGGERERGCRRRAARGGEDGGMSPPGNAKATGARPTSRRRSSTDPAISAATPSSSTRDSRGCVRECAASVTPSRASTRSSGQDRMRAVGDRGAERSLEIVDERHRAIVGEGLDVLAQRAVRTPALQRRPQGEGPQRRVDAAARVIDRLEQAVPPERLPRGGVRGRDEQHDRDAQPPHHRPRVVAEVAVGVVEAHEHRAARERTPVVAAAQHVVEADRPAGAREPSHLATERRRRRADQPGRAAAGVADAVIGRAPPASRPLGRMTCLPGKTARHTGQLGEPRQRVVPAEDVEPVARQGQPQRGGEGITATRGGQERVAAPAAQDRRDPDELQPEIARAHARRRGRPRVPGAAFARGAARPAGSGSRRRS